MDYIISPSVMCMDLMNLGEQIKTLNKHVSMYHVDFIDGVYLKNFSITLPFIAAMRKITDAALDIHVMKHSAQRTTCTNTGASLA